MLTDVLSIKLASREVMAMQWDDASVHPHVSRDGNVYTAIRAVWWDAWDTAGHFMSDATDNDVRTGYRQFRAKVLRHLAKTGGR